MWRRFIGEAEVEEDGSVRAELTGPDLSELLFGNAQTAFSFEKQSKVRIENTPAEDKYPYGPK